MAVVMNDYILLILNKLKCKQIIPEISGKINSKNSTILQINSKYYSID